MAAGIGGHAAMMKAALHYHKHRTGRLAYFAAGFEVLALHPLQLFELEMTTVAGEQLTRRVSEMIAVRVSELNIWRPGGGLEYPFLRVATVEGASRARLARASFESLALGSGQRHRSRRPGAAAQYEDVVRIVARLIAEPPAEIEHRRPLSLQVDGEILAAIRETAPATIEMAARNAIFLSGQS
jgi:diacylglycerol kinase family enzyme